MIMSRVSNLQKPVSFERRLKSWNIEYNFKWNQPYLSRVSNLSRCLNFFKFGLWKLKTHLPPPPRPPPHYVFKNGWSSLFVNLGLIRVLPYFLQDKTSSLASPPPPPDPLTLPSSTHQPPLTQHDPLLTLCTPVRRMRTRTRSQVWFTPGTRESRRVDKDGLRRREEEKKS